MAHRVSYDGPNMKNRDIKNQSSNENIRAGMNAKFEGRRKDQRLLTSSPTREEEIRRVAGIAYVKGGVAVSETPDEWWQGMAPRHRAFMQQLAIMIAETGKSRVVEIRSEEGMVKADLVLLVKRPAERRVLPVLPWRA